MLSHGQTVHFRPHSVIHNQKAEHQSIPKIRLKVNFRHPMKRQIFGDTSGQDPNLHLALCPNVVDGRYIKSDTVKVLSRLI